MSTHTHFPALKKSTIITCTSFFFIYLFISKSRQHLHMRQYTITKADFNDRKAPDNLRYDADVKYKVISDGLHIFFM